MKDNTHEAPMRVLIVDDSVDNAAVLAIFLKKIGHQVDATPDASSAVAKALDFNPHVAMLDIGMPGIDGYMLAAEFRRSDQLANTYLIAVSGYADQDHKGKAANSGFDEYLVKPFSLADVRRVLASALAATEPVQ